MNMMTGRISPKKAVASAQATALLGGALRPSAEERLYMSANGIRQPIGPDDADICSRHEGLVHAEYERCHPGDSFEDLKRRARFSKEDQGLLLDWMAVAAQHFLTSDRKDYA